MIDYSITWEHIVKEMDRRFGFSPTSKEKVSLGELGAYIDAIWSDHVDKINEEEEKNDELS